MLRGITIRQFQEWRAFNDLEPFDEVRADYRAAQIVLELRNLLGRKRGQPAHLLKDCLLKFVTASTVQRFDDVERARAETLATMDMLMLIHNSEPEPKKKANR